MDLNPFGSALDSFEIITSSGVLIWCKKYANVNATVINSFISDVLIGERSKSSSDGKLYKKDSYTLKWTIANDPGLIFIAVYQSLLQLTWVDDFLHSVKRLFTSLYAEKLRRSDTSIIECHFESYFTLQMDEIGKKAGAYAGLAPVSIAKTYIAPGITTSSMRSIHNMPPKIPGAKTPAIRLVFETTDQQPVAREDLRRLPPVVLTSASVQTPRGVKGIKGRRGGGSGDSGIGSTKSNADESSSASVKKSNKTLRKWDAYGNAADSEENIVLDYSTTNSVKKSSEKIKYIDQKEWGKHTANGEFVLKDLGEEPDDILWSRNEMNPAAKAMANRPLNIFKFFVSGRALNKPDFENAIDKMKNHLMRKNVAPEAAIEICNGVKHALFGQKAGSLQNIEFMVQSAVEVALRKILTPTNSLDLLREIERKRTQRVPYVISIVGVNGVGKSTNLSKICFFLLQNKLKVLIAACDTFRSGAVEQLRVHSRNLTELSQREGGIVELYEKGYGKDAAAIAKGAVAYAEQRNFDVVLIDTAGRRHNDQRLMSSLEKFATSARPDKILMVGEALVGTDAVLQARNFNDAFGRGRHLDGIIISKCDTVGDMVGTLVSMVFATGIPIVFLGVGQSYQDLRTLNISWAVKLLMA